MASQGIYGLPDFYINLENLRGRSQFKSVEPGTTFLHLPAYYLLTFVASEIYTFCSEIITVRKVKVTIECDSCFRFTEAMSYKVVIFISQRQPSAERFDIVEKGIWHYANGGTWTESEVGRHVLEMGGSGTSGGLRLKNSGGDQFFIVVGVHNYSLWLDVLPDTKDNDTTVALLPSYYQPGTRSGIALVQSINRNNAKGRNIEFKKVSEDGNQLTCELIIS